MKRLTLISGSRDELDKKSTISIEGRQYPDYVSIGIAYAELVAVDKIPSCRLMQKAAQRFLRMYETAQKEGNEYYWSTAHAVEICAFAETMVHVKGDLATQKLRLEPWQIWVLIAIYGFRRAGFNDPRAAGARLVTIAQLEITRKSGKSLLAAVIGLYELGPNAFRGDDLYIIAPSEALALKVLDPMKEQIKLLPDLASFYKVSTTATRITFGKTESFGMVLPAAGKKQDGHDPKIVIADEFHSIPASIFSVMKSSQGARAESLFLEIGSAGYENFGVGWDERLRCIDILEGRTEELNIFAAIWTIDDEDFGNWENERVIRKANPNAGISLPMFKLKQEIAEIKVNPRNRAETLRTRFNIWGLGAMRLITADQWDHCKDTNLDLFKFSKKRCWIGVDLASRNDMVAYVALFEDGTDIVPFAKHYVPETGPWRDDEEVRDIYGQWIADGHMATTPGSYHTYEELLSDLIELGKLFDVQMVVVDDREANTLAAALSKRGMSVAFWRKNAANFSEPTKDIVARAVGKYKGIKHDGNPVLAWNVQNVIGAVNTADLILPKKPSDHSPMKIDGFDAMVQANAARMEAVPMETTRPVNPMAQRGLRIL